MLLSRLKRLAYRANNEFLAWHYRRHWGMTIGKGVRISRTAKLDKTFPRGVRIGDYTAIAFDAAIITHDFVNGKHTPIEIGSNCLIGARSVIMPGVKVGDNSIVGIGAVVLGDVPANSVVSGNPARIVERGITTGKWGIRNPEFLKLEGIEPVKRPPAPPSVQGSSNDGTIRSLLARYISGDADLSKSFDELGLDSFALVTLRAELEQATGGQIPDDQWVAIERPSQLVGLSITKTEAPERNVRGATARRQVQIDMPQMSMRGLSEGWLFREVGDIHWGILTSALGVKSSEIADQAGERLYATFTRIRMRSASPLAAFRENDTLDIASAMTRFGAGMFFTSTQLRALGRTIEVEAMSSFSKIAVSGDNTSLLKGQPAIPPGFAIPALSSPPDFSGEYRALRAEDPGPEAFSTEYRVVPQTDINGVGLLYFASYPVIAEICLSRFLGQDAPRWSVIERDICYFANCGPDDAIRYCIHCVDKSEDHLAVTASMTRVSDGKRMAIIRSRHGR